MFGSIVEIIYSYMNESDQENFTGEVNWVVSWSWENVTFLVEGTVDTQMWGKHSMIMVWCRENTRIQ